MLNSGYGKSNTTLIEIYRIPWNISLSCFTDADFTLTIQVYPVGSDIRLYSQDGSIIQLTSSASPIRDVVMHQTCILGVEASSSGQTKVIM